MIQVKIVRSDEHLDERVNEVLKEICSKGAAIRNIQYISNNTKPVTAIIEYNIHTNQTV